MSTQSTVIPNGQKSAACFPSPRCEARGALRRIKKCEAKKMKFYILIPALLAVMLSACGQKPELKIQKNLEKSAFQMPRKPASCTQQSSYPRVVRECRVKICKNLKAVHCQGGMDDVASAQWLSCVKEELLVTGANKDDCRLFVYDLEAAMKRR